VVPPDIPSGRSAGSVPNSADGSAPNFPPPVPAGSGSGSANVVPSNHPNPGM